MSNLTYEATVYTHEVNYTNFKGETKTTKLYFALDPIQLMSAIAGFSPKKSKSKNPAKKNEVEITDEQQIEFARSIAKKAAGFPSEDGESWEPFEDFENTLAGKAFLTALVSSDGHRQKFAEAVIIKPFRAFVDFAEADPSNSQTEIANLKVMIGQLENVFSGKPDKNETLEERRARLQAEMDALTADES